MTIAAIPTTYAHTRFRSRLEARWAAFFDLLRWPWEYETLDLNGYIPDFVLTFDTPMIVEVKPLVTHPRRWMHNIDGTYRDANDTRVAIDAINKATEGGWHGEGLLVGAALHESVLSQGFTGTMHKPINAGLLFDLSGEDNGHRYAETWFGTDTFASPFGFKACCTGPVDVVGSFHCRKCGHHDSGPILAGSPQLQQIWRVAGNRVQWRR